MTETELLALLQGADDPRQRPRRTRTGTLIAYLLPVVLVAALAEPLLVLTGVAGLLVAVTAARRLTTGGGRTRRESRRFCLPGTSVCMQY